MEGFLQHQVPVTIETKARELQVIRRKHQDDHDFDFLGSDYPNRIIREADHQNV